MQHTSHVLRALRALFVAAALGLGLGMAMAQAEPTMNEIYATAQAGKLDQAQVMVQQVLVAHPSSAKAHYVQSELFARQGNLSRAREALAAAEKIAPGLPFAKADAVQALRAQLTAQNTAVSSGAATVQHTGSSGGSGAGAVSSAGLGNTSSSGSWLLPVLLAGGVITAAYFVFRRKAQPQVFEQPVYNNGLNGAQTFGNGAAAMPAGYGPGNGPGYGPGYGPGPAYGATQGSGLGGRIMGGVATGLAVGAGVMAAEAIGRNLMGGHDSPSHPANNLGSNDFQSNALNNVNTDMGGQNFGITDNSSWDDGGSVDMGGGGGSDWDN